ncbi:MAG: hypothetical protein ABIY51_08935 [Ferruginibacter sp.]
MNIEDNVVGFDFIERNSKGMGIGNIFSRAALYKGEVIFFTQPGEGCRLNISFPQGSIIQKKKTN